LEENAVSSYEVKGTKMRKDYGIAGKEDNPVPTPIK
jgi:hypothetical protein